LRWSAAPTGRARRASASSSASSSPATCACAAATPTTRARRPRGAAPLIRNQLTSHLCMRRGNSDHARKAASRCGPARPARARRRAAPGRPARARRRAARARRRPGQAQGNADPRGARPHPQRLTAAPPNLTPRSAPRSDPRSAPRSARSCHALPTPAAERFGRRALSIRATLTSTLYPAARRYTRPDEETVDGAAAAPEGGGKGDAAAESEFGFVTLDRTHTLKSFASYADWAKALHFSDPLPQARLPARGGPARGAARGLERTAPLGRGQCAYGMGLRGGGCSRGARLPEHGTAVARSVPCCCCRGSLGVLPCRCRHRGLSRMAVLGRVLGIGLGLVQG